MGLKDAHDPREFLHYAQFAKDGTIAAVVEVAADVPFDGIEITDLYPYDLSTVKVKPSDVTKGDKVKLKAALKAASDAQKDTTVH